MAERKDAVHPDDNELNEDEDLELEEEEDEDEDEEDEEEESLDENPE